MQEGDSRYLAKETLNPPQEGELVDLTKSDIFSAGLTIYQCMAGGTLPGNGDVWQDLRSGKLDRIKNVQGYSN